MLYRLAAIVLIFISPSLYGQSFDSLVNTVLPVDTLITVREQKLDSLLTGGEQQLDSIEAYAASQYASLKSSYDSVSLTVNLEVGKINHALDSLHKLNAPTNKLTQKLDSIEHWKNEKLNRINAKVDTLKSRVEAKITKLDLPPQLQEKSAELTSAVSNLNASLPMDELPASFKDKLGIASLSDKFNGLELPGVSTKLGVDGLPDLNVPSLDNQSLPNVTAGKIPDTKLPPLSELEIPNVDTESIGKVTGELQQYQDQISAVPKDLDEVGKLAETEASKISTVADAQKELGQVSEISGMAGAMKDEEAMKKQLKQEVKKQAVNHFAGKEEQLQKAMDVLGKYKQKYSSLQSLSDIPKRRPNEMRGKPLIERLVPGIALQIFIKDDWMVDFNPYVGYRFNSRLTVGAGWNYRVAYNHDHNQFNSDARVYGPRSYGEFKIGKGFSGHLQVEYMNTFVPPQFSSVNKDLAGREWVFSTLAGMKKEYRFIKNVKGTVYILYNLYDPHHRSPYTDKLVMRMGFEFPMKKKRKQHN